MPDRRGAPVPAVVWIGLVAFIGLGLPEATLGVTWPSIRVELDQPLRALGLLLGALTAGYLPVSAVSGRLTRRFGTASMLTAASTVFATAMALYLFAPSFPFLVAGSLLGGVAAGIIDPGINTHFALHHGTATMNLLHAAFGVGATAGPFVATGIIGSGGSWRLPYAIYLVAQIALVIGFVATRRHWSTPSIERPGQAVAASGIEVQASGSADPDPSRARVAIGLSAATFFVYTGLEVGAGVLAFTLLSEGRGLSATAAGLWTTAYWGGLTLGRVTLGIVGRRLEPDQILRVGSLTAVAASTLVIVDPGGSGAAGFPLLGLAVAGIFPSLVLLTPRRVGRSRTPDVIGIQFALASVGAAGVPAVISVIAEHDLERIGIALLVLAVTVATLDRVLSGLTARWTDRTPLAPT